MHRSLRHALRLALLALALPLLACEPSWLTVVIPDFSSKQIEGIWIWRLSPQTNQYQRDTLVQFGSVTTLASGRILSYSTYANQGDTTLTAGVVPSPANPDVVKVTLGFQRGLPGVFKVSTFNAAGESLLSNSSDSL